MPHCSTSSKKQGQTVLLFVTLGLGSLSSTCIAGYFGYKWFTEMSVDQRKKMMLRLCFAIVNFLAIERIGRLLELYLLFNATKSATNINYYINNAIAVNGIFGCLMYLLTTKLIRSFVGSVYAIRNKERQVLYSLLAGYILFGNGTWLLDSISLVRERKGGDIIVGLTASVTLILGIVLMIKVNFGFGERVRSLVASSASHDWIHRMNDNRQPRHQTGAERLHSNEIDIEQLQLPQQNAPVRTSTINNIKRATLSVYEISHQQLLRSAAKSMNIAVFITFGLGLVFAAVVLIELGRCQDWKVISGNILLICSYILIGLAVLFSLPMNQVEYEMVCYKCDRLIQKVVAYQTEVQVRSMSMVGASPPR